MAEALQARDDSASRLEVEVGRSRRLASELEAAKTESSCLQQRVARLVALQDTFEQVRRSGSALAAALGEHQVFFFPSMLTWGTQRSEPPEEDPHKRLCKKSFRIQAQM